MIRFVHTADLHFGVENYGRIDPATGIHTRLLDFHRALRTCVEQAVHEDVDFFLFCGDAYKTAQPTPTQQRLLFDCFLHLFRAGIPAVMVVGNHDNPASFGKSHALELFGQIPVSGFHVISKPERLVLQTKRGPIQIVGIPWPSRSLLALNRGTAPLGAELSAHIGSRVAELIRFFSEQCACDPKVPAILAGHLTVSSGLFSGSEKRAICGQDPLLLPSQLAIAPFSYVALGHLHRFQQVNKGQSPAIVYPGSVERIDFGERNEEKGFCIVSVEAGAPAEYTFVPLVSRPFIQLEVRLEGELRHTEQLMDALKNKPIADAILKVVYHVPPGVKDRVDTRLLQQACSSAMYVVGFFPIHAPMQRTVRSTIHVDMDVESALRAYLAGQKQPGDRIERLAYLLHQIEKELQDDATPTPDQDQTSLPLALPQGQESYPPVG
ncbi:TPA: hypothetical protein DDZ86_02710 [Candidatus Dependentiae bacterium]|nr:MAG: Nuclease SbcCD, D subunit [candidate division TM6 bacterium GW2011_GWF2_43_87]HBL98530.1 hypothetical protein [Candidatus Dependentiae bacterium]